MKDLRTVQAKRIEKVRESTRQSVIRGCRIDPVQIDWHDPDFSIGKLREAMFRRMREAAAESSFPHLHGEVDGSNPPIAMPGGISRHARP